MNVANLKRQLKSGAYNFYWIAGLSMANSIFFFFISRSSFAVGLGFTQFMDTLAHNIAQSYPNAVLLIQSIGLLLDLFICSVFVVSGYFASKGQRWAFISGMLLYGLDAILTLVSPDFIGFGFHLFFLWFLFSGLQALDKLKEIIPETASAKLSLIKQTTNRFLMPSRQIYLLSPKALSPETIAVAFAKTSRSPESFQEIAGELSDEKSARFHEKWVVGYGHASVAEHAVLHIAIENVSRLAVECIESNRLASYTEKSTRYQKWDGQAFLIPPELDGHPLLETYISTCKLLFQTYLDSLQPMRLLVERQTSRRENEAEDAYDRRIRSQYVDSCRFLLPAASLANLGMTANARVLERAISKMLSHPLAEVRQIGEEVKRVAQVEVPTLVKYAGKIPYLMETGKDFSREPKKPNGGGQAETTDWCNLIDFEPDGENKVFAAALFRFGKTSYAEALERLRSTPEAERLSLAKSLLGRLGEHDTPLRELEFTSYTFELVLDQGGYAEFKRHRMMTQTPQALTTRLGYAVPHRIGEAGFELQYHSVMRAAAETYEKLADWDPQVAAYIVPNGFNRRVLFSMNLREAFAFCQLRSSPNAHFSMRRVAQRVAAEIRRVHPLLADYMLLPDEKWQDIESQYFAQV